MTKTIVATLGDSITAGTPGWDPDKRVRERTGSANAHSQYQYWAALATPELEFRNHGVNGERTDEIRRRLSEAAAGATAIVVQGGINDIVQGRAIEETAGDLLAMTQQARTLGLSVAVAELLPWNNGGREGVERVNALNALLRRIVTTEGAVMLPFHQSLSDPGHPDRMPSGWTADGNHPSVEGYRRLGELAFSRWW